MRHVSTISENIHFSKYPCEETFEELRQLKVTTLVDLTTSEDAIPPYNPSGFERVIFPVKDRGVANDAEVLRLMGDLQRRLAEGEVICFHCVGGHGRSATLAGILYGLYYQRSYLEVLMKVFEAHQRREIMKDKWRKLGAPQGSEQRSQIARFLKDF